MNNLMLEPLKFYEQVGKSTHEQNANEFFDKIVKDSKIDLAENRKTSSLYRKQQAVADGSLKKLKGLKILRGFLIAFTVIGFVLALICLAAFTGVTQLVVSVIGIVSAVICLLVVCLSLNKKIKGLKELFDAQKEKADETLSKAQKQMASLNSLFSEKDTFFLIEKTLPNLKFEDNYTVALSKDFIENFDYVDSITSNRSVIDTLAGRYNGNPFLFYRYVNHYLGTKTYHGTKLISWTVRVRGSDGRYHTETRTQTLHAKVSKPYPYYNYGTALGYGNQTAPNLSFSRQATDVEELNERQVARRVKKGEKKLEKLSKKALESGGQFTEMANSEFDVLFGALDRNHEVQFRLMFSPVAQINMVKLLKAKNIGYGDDFSFTKRGKFNCIISEHAQRWPMNTSPTNYYSYDVDIARKNFVNFNKEYFKSVFFDFAPLFSVPTYQDKPISVFEPLEKYDSNYTYYDYEVLANAIGKHNFAHHSSVTEVILKSNRLFSTNSSDCVQIKASSYAGTDRVDFIPVMGGDGRLHSVPVPWVEYTPVHKVSTVLVKRIGISSNELITKTAETGVSSVLFNTPTAYTHGLFAKIVNEKDVNAIDGVLEKIKN